MRRIILFSGIAIVLVIVGFFSFEVLEGREKISEGVVEVTATDFAFRAPDETPNGWTNIQYTNDGNEPHFLLILRMPEGHTFDDYAAGVVSPFNDVWYEMRDDGIGQAEAMEKLGAVLPEWFWSVEFIGGTGVIDPGSTAHTTLNLKPGSYVLECYMKNEEGEMHNMEGMLRELTVTENSSDILAPEADVEVTLRNFEMDIKGTLDAGTNTIAVHAEEHPEEGFGHNVHLARLDDDAEAEEVVQWVNFFNPGGMEPPAPASFLGGVNIMPEGQTGYFTVDLEPGRHLLVSEYTSHEGVLQEVTVE